MWKSVAAAVLSNDPVSCISHSCPLKVQLGALAHRCRAPIDWPLPEAMLNPAVID